MDILILLLISEEILSAFHHWVYIYGLLLCWGSFPLWALSEEFFFFIINEGRILLKAFSASTEIIIWFLFFSLLMCCITLIDMQILKNLCIPEINSTWSLCVILLIYCWIRFANILLMILHLCLSVTLACNSLFCVISLSGFGIRVIVALLNEFGSIPSSAVFWNSFRRIGVNSSLNAW